MEQLVAMAKRRITVEKRQVASQTLIESHGTELEKQKQGMTNMKKDVEQIKSHVKTILHIVSSK